MADLSTLSDAELLALHEKSQKQFTPTQAVIRKYGEGLTGGLSTPITGAIKGVFGPGTIGENIQQLKEESKQIDKQYPTLAPVSEIFGIATPQGLAGAVGKSTVIGLGRTGKVAAPFARMAGQVMSSGAYEGAKAVSGDSKEAASDILRGLAYGTAGGVIGEGVIKAGKPMGKLLASLRGIKPQSIEAYASNPKAVNEAIKLQMDGELIPSFVDDVNRKISEFVSSRTSQIDEILQGSTEKVNISAVKQVARKELDNLSRIKTTPMRVQQIANMKRQVALIDALPDEMAAADVNAFKKDLQDQLSSFYNQTKISRDVGSRALSEVESSVRGAVESVDPRIKVLNKELQKGIELQKELKIGAVRNTDEGVSGGLQPETAKRWLSTLWNPDKRTVRTSASKFDKLFGTNFEEASRIFTAARDLATQDVLSSMSTGRSVYPMLAAGLLGGAAGQGTVGKSALGLAGALTASPMMTRPLISLAGAVGKSVESGLAPRAAFGIARRK